MRKLIRYVSINEYYEESVLEIEMQGEQKAEEDPTLCESS